jgi:hypothetical protein
LKFQVSRANYQFGQFQWDRIIGRQSPLYGRTGREEKGRKELTAAMDMYREMGMDFFLKQAEEVLADVAQ